MALTTLVKDELANYEATKVSARKAEISTILRFTGGLHIVSGRPRGNRPPHAPHHRGDLRPRF